MRVVFAGTPGFAAHSLEAIVAAGHDVALVLTQPDRPSGRGQRLSATAVSDAAVRLGIPTEKPASLKSSEMHERLRSVGADVMAVAAYGLILPGSLLVIPRSGCLNVHASLLPRWRGAAPIHRALLAGDDMTGISIMQMDSGLDTGPVLLERRLAIGPRDTTATLTEALAKLGGTAISDALANLDSLLATPQDSSRATYAAKISKTEARIDWTRSSRDIERQVRAFDPAPGAETEYLGSVLKVWECVLADGNGAPGTVLEVDRVSFTVACGDAALTLLQLQRAGGRKLSAAEFLRGSPIAKGGHLGSK